MHDFRDDETHVITAFRAASINCSTSGTSLTIEDGTLQGFKGLSVVSIGTGVVERGRRGRAQVREPKETAL